MRATVSQCVVRVDEAALRVAAGRPVLAWVLRECVRFGVDDVLLLLADGMPPERIPADVPGSLPRPVRIATAAAEPRTGGGLFGVRERLRSRFLLCDGGILLDCNLGRLLADAAADPATVAGRLMQGAGGGRVALFRKAVLDQLRPGCSLEADFLPGLVSRGAVRVTAAAMPEVTPDRLRRKALFLDRDGVLNIDHGYVGSGDRFEWVDGALDAIRHATAAGWHVFVVTNQSGVARGLFTEADVRRLLDWIADEARRAGGTIDDMRYCPFHPDGTLAAYRQAHPWRKPMPGMLLDLIRAWELDPARSVMVGDQPTDMAAAAAAGVAGHLFAGGNLAAFLLPVLDALA